MISLFSYPLWWPLLLILTSVRPETPVRWPNGTQHDFGSLPLGRTVSHSFLFENAASVPILLQTVRTECGCTVADWPETPIAPGERGEVLIEFHADRSGYFRKKIKVYFDRQRRAEVLWVSGIVE
jgi:hypothetical protein